MWDTAPHRAHRDARHEGAGDRVRPRPPARARRDSDRRRLGDPRRGRGLRPATSHAPRSPARAGTSSTEVRAAGSRGAAVELMEKGVRAVCLRLWLEGRLDGALCLGGAEGAILGAAAMRALPVGVPKLIVSPSASGRRAFAPFVGESDVLVHALGRRHPRAEPDRARRLRQRGRGGRRHGPRRRAAARVDRPAGASASRCSATRRPP